MLKGIKKNLKENYDQIISLKRKDQLKTKEDVPVIEAFELYMLKKFHNIKLNTLANNMLNFWEKDFDQVIEKHIALENQKDGFDINFSFATRSLPVRSFMMPCIITDCPAITS